MTEYRMHWQAAFYLMAPFQAENFVFIAVEKLPPLHLVGLYELDHAQYRKTVLRVRDAMERYAECKFKGEFPGYSPLIETITLPDWAV